MKKKLIDFLVLLNESGPMGIKVGFDSEVLTKTDILMHHTRKLKQHYG